MNALNPQKTIFYFIQSKLKHIFLLVSRIWKRVFVFFEYNIFWKSVFYKVVFKRKYDKIRLKTYFQNIFLNILLLLHNNAHMSCMVLWEELKTGYPHKTRTTVQSTNTSSSHNTMQDTCTAQLACHASSNIQPAQMRGMRKEVLAALSLGLASLVNIVWAYLRVDAHTIPILLPELWTEA